MARGSEIQIENGGFTRIHNEILCQLANADMNGPEFRCVFYLLRMTYGYQKKEAKISLDEWAVATGLDRGNVARTLRNLIQWRVILKTETGNGRGHKSTYAFNKYYEQWFAPENSVGNDTVVSDINSVKNDMLYDDKQCQKPPLNSVNSDTRYISTKESKERKKERKGKNPATQEPPHASLFGAICKAIGWDHRTLTTNDRGQVAQTCGILAKADYTAEDIDRFMVEVWFHDWRWMKKQDRPTLNQLRQEIGKLRASSPEIPSASPNGTYNYSADIGNISWQFMFAQQEGTNDEQST